MRTAALVILSAVGLFIATYFTLLFYGVIRADARFVPRFCRLEGRTCGLVLHHPDARVLGVPNAVLGICFSLLVLVGVAGPPNRLIACSLVYAAWGTVAMASYLVYSLYAKLRVGCTLCLVAHGVNVLIALLLTFG